MLDFILLERLFYFQPYKYYWILDKKYTRNCQLNGLSSKYVNLKGNQISTGNDTITQENEWLL